MFPLCPAKNAVPIKPRPSPTLQDTLMCLEMGAIETLIVWESFDVERIEVMGPGGKNDVKYLTPEQVCVCACVCLCARVRACACACVCVFFKA